ncbi:3-deoxy-manno-octulosonate cytidylyltransferase [Pelagibacteraceae bacterium]|nr:3-deoxy-manno-octulosonate cytidylyltransferase [Pelagibacteraceae bacterium]
MKNVVIIPSRMASTRLPGKPLMEIDGMPMIQRVWQQAIASKIGEVFVACSEIEVHDLIVSNGGNAIMTDPDLPSGTDRVHSAFLKIKNNKDIDVIINLQGDMPLINPEHILKVIDPIKENFTIGTLATNLNDNELNNPNVTKVEVDFKKNEIAQALGFYREVTIENKNLYHHVGIYSYTPDSINTFINLPKSKNEIDLSLEQMRAMDSNIPIGVTYVPEVPISVDTKEDLINIETNIREHNDKS